MGIAQLMPINNNSNRMPIRVIINNKVKNKIKRIRINSKTRINPHKTKKIRTNKRITGIIKAKKKQR